MYKENNTQWHISTVMGNPGNKPHYVINRFRRDLGHYEIHARFNTREEAQAELTKCQSVL